MADEEKGVPGGEQVANRVVTSLEDLASLETQTIAAEVNVLGQLRDRMCTAARHGDAIQNSYRRVHHKSGTEAEESTFLSEGFPSSEGRKPLFGLLVIDGYSIVDAKAPTETPGGPRIGQYTGDRLYLSRDKKWILAERTGQYSEAEDSTSEWSAECKPIVDRQVLDRYSLEMVTAGVFAATDKVWERLSPRMDLLKKRYDKVLEVTGMLAKFTGFTPERPVPKKEEEKPIKRSLTRR